MNATTATAATVALCLALAFQLSAQQRASDEATRLTTRSGIVLEPTNHPVLPRDIRQLWLAPANGRPAARPAASTIASAFDLVDQGEYAKALPRLTRPDAQDGVLGDYALYYAALAQLNLERESEARRTFQSVLSRRPIGYLAEAAALGEASAAEQAGDHRDAVAIYERLAAMRTTAPEEVHLRLGRAARAANDLERAATAFARVYFEFPLSAQAELAYTELKTLPNFQPITAGSQRYTLELGRAERLFGARRYADAREAFQALRSSASGDDRELVNLRIAESQYFLGRHRDARDGVRPYVQKASRQGEAMFFYALASRQLGDRATYSTTVRRIADEFPTQSWTAEALNDLATQHILRDEDAEADRVFRELYDKGAKGVHADRAAWKVGWRAYRERRFAETVRYFDQAAADFPRNDYRPAWLYWSGRAYEALGEKTLARERFTLAAADYQNSYYGRLAVEELGGRAPAPRVVGEPTSVLPPPANEPLVRALLAVARYDDALRELRYAQRAWGDSPAIQATIAWVYQQQGRSQSGRRQFELLRASINTMRRAYPQFMAAGGEQLPREVLTVIFPLSYWNLIEKYSKPHGLDPYLVAALMAQESTFVPDIRSSANAVGLMQLMSATARRYARTLGLRYSAQLLRNPEANVRMGTAYLADKIREFGAIHLALASYNAGETPVRRWMAERPGLRDRAEFIDDIPYPETQTYVKRILGTAEDYRSLYAD